MKKYIYLAVAVIMALAVGSCSKDNPFDNFPEGSTGRLLKSSLSVSLETDGGPRSLKNRNVRMAAPAADEFTVDFVKGEETVASYKYKEMPEIVTLPVGTYKAVAYYGENPAQAWESPYYKGESEGFEIVADAITDDVKPIVCKLANVRVSVNFDEKLKAVMGDDCKVRVVVGELGQLDFTINDTERSGFFAFVENSTTLAANFTGMVDGARANETKTYDNVAPGNHYAITFRLHDAGEEDPGNITGKDDNGIIHVDATVETTDENIELDPGETILPDDMRPQEGEDPGHKDPEPDVPDVPAGNPPVISANSAINLDADNLMEDDLEVELYITSEKGIKEFIVKIESEILEQELDGMLPMTLDLVNTPDDYNEALQTFGFQTRVGGEKSVTLKLTEFIPMILLVSGDRHSSHHFVLTVTDENGTTQRTLKLYN